MGLKFNTHSKKEIVPQQIPDWNHYKCAMLRHLSHQIHRNDI